MKPRCEDCRHFNPDYELQFPGFGGPGSIRYVSGEPYWGQCRVNPPVVKDWSFEDRWISAELRDLGIWPIISEDDYCGAYAPSPDEEDE